MRAWSASTGIGVAVGCLEKYLLGQKTAEAVSDQAQWTIADSTRCQ
jgi:hypothetical protein